MPPREVPPRVRPPSPGPRPDDFDAIREAVMETSRGRWFLEEYAARLRRSETAGLIDHMKRLETALAANHDEVMSRLAAALREGAEDSENNEGPAPTAPAAEREPRLTPRHMKYYRADEDLFEPAPEAALTPVPRLVDLAQQDAECQPPRRRIVVIRHKPGEQIDVPLADDMARAS